MDLAEEPPAARPGTGSGVMLLRAWVEDGRLVTRVRWSVVGDTEQRADVLAGQDAVLATVRRWLAEVDHLAVGGAG